MGTYRALPPLRVGDEIEYRTLQGEVKTARIGSFDLAGMIVPAPHPVYPQPSRIWRADITSVKRLVNGQVKMQYVGYTPYGASRHER